ncbi:hypothetical protein ACE5IS_04130 [Leptospira wolffii]|uniref:Uncharacterized protein n=1 Tax=Leptospira wolffii TaxID=409998 RepID=A0A2M9ZDA4_9LEPT|nr:hypothetical protein [Leptospira wolffii]EPG68223.1 hypothetical protein LEP1GSC061_0376 [Leptospira wolffii serovar Khorat str. Khorat-H2]PJZ66332.1 hypothetical protein CH371_08630 [Leptospira wolffii]TGK60113.1 hypothetical protein EHQ32_09415 [Leptospira wolffii]TGK72456.1 hypothetical protein EHQ27_08340 [Leptospira wolffii]TGK76120.1 hypothetical protein EHQ35_02165 [Leptospira wolffii]
MRLNEPLSGYGAATDILRRTMVENPHTLTNVIAQNEKAVREYSIDKKYAVQMYTETFSLSPEYRERLRNSYTQRIGEIEKEIRSFKGPKPEGSKERMFAYDKAGRKTEYRTPTRATVDYIA